MFKIIGLSFALCISSTSINADEPIDKDKVQAEILYAGYECDSVDDVQKASFWDEVTVTCDKVYRFIIRYERGGVTVEVKS